MSSPLCAFCNRRFITELRELGDMNVLLLMVDGSAVFGRIADIPTNSCVLRIVQSVGVPFPMGITGGVVFRPANPDLVCPLIVSQLFVDVNDVAFVIWGTFATIPLFFGLDCECHAFGQTASTVEVSSSGKGSLRSDEQDGRQGFFGGTSGGGSFNNGWCALLAELRELVVRNIGLVTLGGWTVIGQLGQVNDGVALLNPATATIPFATNAGTLTVSGPAIPGGALLIPTSVSAWTNLVALTQILQP